MKTSSIFLRVLLLAVLPTVGAIIYLQGQHVDPGLIRFQQAVGQEAAGEAFFPDGIDGFRRFAEIRRFTRDNLYEYVNGHAEFFITAGFVKLAVAEYGPATGKDGSAQVVVEIYNMGKDIQAFGVLSDESEGKTVTLTGGAVGFKSDREIRFIKGPYYIKIIAFTDGVPLEAFATQIDRQIHGDADSFSEFSRLPALGKVMQTRYIREAYRGLDFLNQVIEREYRLDDKTLTAFLHVADPQKIKALTAAFMQYFHQSAIPFETIPWKKTTVYKIKDPYEGNWVLIPLSDALLGIFGEIDDKTLDLVMQKEEGP